MSKSTIKKLLQSMTKAEIIEMVLELYSPERKPRNTWSSMPVLMRKENSKNTRVLFVRSSILREDENHKHAFPFAERLWLTSRNSSRPLMPLRN